jgi:kynureninase
MRIEESLVALGDGPLNEAGIATHLRPLFTRVLAAPTGQPAPIYLATNSLGRPPDQAFDDVLGGLRVWTLGAVDAWAPWLAQEHSYRTALASLLQVERPDCVVPKASAGQALRAVLNTLPIGSTVITTTGEFASVSVVLAQYQAAGRLNLLRVQPQAEALIEAMRQQPGVRLAVVSQVLYSSGAIVQDLPAISRACREQGAELLVDCYHALGAMPVSMDEIGCGYLIGGCYKYLRGGPGAAFLAIAPRLSSDLKGAGNSPLPLDIGWFAMQPGRDPWEPGGPHLRPGGDAWVDGTPAVLPYYQAQSGLALTLGLGVQRLRAYQLQQTQYLRHLLEVRGISSKGGDQHHGAFVTLLGPKAEQLAALLNTRGVVVTAREGRLRLCPDCLVSRSELEQAVEHLEAASATLR